MRRDDIPNFTTREKRLIKRFCDGEYFYHSHSPKISKKEVESLFRKGFWLQVENPLHEPTMIYPVHPNKFRQRAIKLGIRENDETR